MNEIQNLERNRGATDGARSSVPHAKLSATLPDHSAALLQSMQDQADRDRTQTRDSMSKGGAASLAKEHVEGYRNLSQQKDQAAALLTIGELAERQSAYAAAILAEAPQLTERASREWKNEPAREPVLPTRDGLGPDHNAQAKRTAESEDADKVPIELRKKYLVAANAFYFRDDTNKVAFEDVGNRLSTKHNDAEVVRSMVSLAQSKGWFAIRVTGTDEFRQSAWLEASLQGLQVQGYAPRAIDHARLADLRTEVPRSKDNNLTKSGGEHRGPTLDEGKSSHRPASNVEPSLAGEQSDAQRAAIQALAAIARARGDSEIVVKKLSEAAAERFAGERVQVGTILGHGRAPYMHKPGNQPNYYVTTRSAAGQETSWGLDLERALKSSEAKVGQEVVLKREPRAPNAASGEFEIRRWSVIQIDRLREDARAASKASASKRRPVVKMYDANAPRGDAERALPKPERQRNTERERR